MNSRMIATPMGRLALISHSGTGFFVGFSCTLALQRGFKVYTRFDMFPPRLHMRTISCIRQQEDGAVPPDCNS